MNARRIRPLTRRIEAEIDAGPSKSFTHRALVAAALASGPSAVVDPLVADDTRITLDGLRGLGVAIVESADRWTVPGLPGALPGGGVLDLGDSGTSLRFLLSVAALGRAPSRLDGSPRLRERPLEELAVALRSLGGEVELTAGRLPALTGGLPPAGGTVAIPSGRSSQFASSLLLIGSRLPGGLDLHLEAPVVSSPYVELTVSVLRAFGVAVSRIGDDHWRVEEGSYPGTEYRVEGDHSAASYFLAAAAVTGGRLRVRGLSPDSQQADACLQRILADAGCDVLRGPDWIEVRGHGEIRPMDLDMAAAPDLVPTLAVLALFAEGPSTFRRIGHLRHKESDRLELLARNLEALGRPARATADRLEIGPPVKALRGGTVVTASDHRMAMAFAIAGLRVPGIVVDDADCVGKSNPGFWDQLDGLRRLRTGS